MKVRSRAGRVLIVDDERGIRDVLTRLVRQEGHEPLQAADGAVALDVIRRESPDVLLLDVKIPAVDGMEVLRQAKRLDPDLPVVIITSHATVKDAVGALRGGAHDYIVKPFEHGDVIRSLHSAMTTRGLHRTIRILSDRTPEAAQLHDLMGPSEAVSQICADVVRVASSDFTVLIIGETGSGKELVARAIHQASPRSAGPFVAVDCGAIPETLFESELFGHDKGAFTGADSEKPGKLEVAKAGTLFLDEVLNMPRGSQVKLLRALQERTIYRVGGTRPLSIDVRVIVAAGEGLEGAVSNGTFRKDLFFRLNEFVMPLPPLRQRTQDIIFLATRFLNLTNRELGKTVRVLSQHAVERLLTYDWPGNVRQLRSAVRRAVLLADTVVEPGHLGLPERPSVPDVGSEVSDVAESELPLKQLVRRATAAVEAGALMGALKKTGGNKAKAARLLKIDNKTMHSKLKEYGLRSLPTTGG